jgi:hypothetical protein
LVDCCNFKEIAQSKQLPIERKFAKSGHPAVMVCEIETFQGIHLVVCLKRDIELGSLTGKLFSGVAAFAL